MTALANCCCHCTADGIVGATTRTPPTHSFDDIEDDDDGDKSAAVPVMMHMNIRVREHTLGTDVVRVRTGDIFRLCLGLGARRRQ
jgi:hypothetical protein